MNKTIIKKIADYDKKITAAKKQESQLIKEVGNLLCKFAKEEDVVGIVRIFKFIDKHTHLKLDTKLSEEISKAMTCAKKVNKTNGAKLAKLLSKY